MEVSVHECVLNQHLEEDVLASRDDEVRSVQLVLRHIASKELPAEINHVFLPVFRSRRQPQSSQILHHHLHAASGDEGLHEDPRGGKERLRETHIGPLSAVEVAVEGLQVSPFGGQVRLRGDGRGELLHGLAQTQPVAAGDAIHEIGHSVHEVEVQCDVLLHVWMAHLDSHRQELSSGRQREGIHLCRLTLCAPLMLMLRTVSGLVHSRTGEDRETEKGAVYLGNAA